MANVRFGLPTKNKETKGSNVRFEVDTYKPYYDETEKKIATMLFGKDKNLTNEERETFNNIVTQYNNDKKVRKIIDKGDNAEEYLKSIYYTQTSGDKIAKLEKQLQSPILSEKKKQEIQKEINTLKYQNQYAQDVTLQANIDASPGVKIAATVGKALNNTVATPLKLIEGLFTPITNAASNLVEAIDEDAGRTMKDTFKTSNNLSSWYANNAQEMDKFAYNTDVLGYDLTNIGGDILSMAYMMVNPKAAYAGIFGNEYTQGVESGKGVGRSLADATAKTAISYTIERLGGMKPGQGNAINQITAKGILRSALEEVGEEELDLAINTMYDFITQNPDNPYANMSPEEAVNKYIRDAVSTAVGTGISVTAGGVGGKLVSGTKDGKSLPKKSDTKNIAIEEGGTELGDILNRAEQNMTPKEKAQYEASQKQELAEDLTKVTETKKVEKETKKVEKNETKIEEKPKTEEIKKSDDDEIAYRKQRDEKLRAQGLDDSHIRAVNKWAGSDSYIINEELREGRKLPKDYQETSEKLSEVLTKSPSISGEFRRSITLDGEKLENFKKRYVEGATVTEPSFTSAAKTGIYDKTMNVQILYDATDVKDVSDLMRKNENEVMFDKNTTFEVEGVVEKNGKLYVRMHQVETPNKVETNKTEKLPKKETKTEEVKVEESKKTEKIPTKKTGEPTAEQLAKIEESEKRKFEAGLAKAGVEVKKTNNTPEALKARHDMIEKSLDSFEKNYKNTPKKDQEKFVENKLKVYEKYLEDGGEPIEGYAETLAKYRLNKVVETAVETEKTNKVNLAEQRSLYISEDAVETARNTALEIIEKNETIDDLIEQIEDGDMLMVAPQNSELKETYQRGHVPQKDVNKKFANKIKRLFYNTYNTLVEIDKNNGNENLQNKYLQTVVSKSEGQYQISGAQTDLNGNRIGKSIQEIAQPIVDLGDKAMSMFNVYANIQYDLTRKKMARDYGIEYADNRFAEYSIEQEELMVKQLKKENPELMKIADDVFKDIQTFYKNSNNIKINSGMLPETMKTSKKFAKEQMKLSDKTIEALTDSEGNIKVNTADYLSVMNPYYFKTERDVEWYTNPVSYQEPNITVRGNKGLKEGANRHAIFSIFDSMSIGAINDRVVIRNNTLYQDVAKTVGKSVKIEKVTTATGNDIFIPADDGKYSMRYYVDGKLKTSLVSSEIYETLGRTDTVIDMFGSTSLGKGVKAVNQFRRAVLTTANPGFLVRNAAMDWQDANLNSNYGAVQYNKNYIKALKEISTNSEGFKKFTALGGAYGVQGFSNERGFITKETTVRKVANKVEQISSLVEAVPRYAEYLCAIENGKSQTDALREAKEVTVNFTKAGELFRTLDRNGITAFMGASSAGLNRAYQTVVQNQIDAINVLANRNKTGEPLTARDKKILLRSGMSISKLVIAGIAPALVNGLLYDDDDEEFLASVPQYIRNNNYIIKIGDDGKYIAIPRGRLTAVTQMIGNLVTNNKISDSDKLDVLTALKFAWENIGLNRVEDASTISPIIDVFKNENYYGSAIYKDADSATKKALKSANYISKNLGGIVYDVAKFAVTQDTDSIPVISKFYKDTKSETAYNSRYYSIKEKYENSSDPLEKLKFTSVKYDYNKYVSPIKKELEALKEQKASAKKIAKKEKELLEAYRSVYGNLNDKPKDISGNNDKSIIYYRGYVYKLIEDENGNVYYRKS